MLNRPHTNEATLLPPLRHDFQIEFTDIDTTDGKLVILAAPRYSNGTVLPISRDINVPTIECVETAMRQMLVTCDFLQLKLQPRHLEIRFYPDTETGWELAGEVRWHPSLEKPIPSFHTVEIIDSQILYEDGETVIEMAILPVGEEGPEFTHRIVLESSRPWVEQAGLMQFHQLVRAIGADEAVEDATDLMFQTFTVGLVEGEIVQYLIPAQPQALTYSLRTAA